MKQATLAKYHARSLEIALPGRRHLLKENVEQAEQKSIIAQSHLSSASIATLLARKTTSVALADGVYCLHNWGSSAILRLDMIQLTRRVRRGRQHFGGDVLSIEGQ